MKVVDEVIELPEAVIVKAITIGYELRKYIFEPDGFKLVFVWNLLKLS